MIKKILILFFLLAASVNNAQTKFSVGGNFGIGQIKGNSPTITSLAWKFYVDAHFDFLPAVSIAASFIYAQHTDKFIPGDKTNRYFPFIKAYAITVNNVLYLNEMIFIKSGIGGNYVNERIFSGESNWEFGFSFFTSPGLDFRGEEENGFTLNASFDFGMTFSGNAPSYFLFTIGTEYYF
ncbi:MAG: hypothetical protein GXO87_14655 [Chlorobi bacterium]|nr:hypothetical protein [Chlorobiota bacterium]